MSLPTASTPGYGYFIDKNNGRKHVACHCVIRFLTAAEKLGLARGLIKVGLDIIQLTGGAEASGNTHSLGAAFDTKQCSRAWSHLYREMSAAFWPRLDDPTRSDDLWDDNQHGHGVIDCPHDKNCSYQYTAYWRGYSGLGKATSGPYAGMCGYGSKDPDPWRPAYRRTWEQGEAWALAQAKKLTTPTAPTPAPTVPEEDDMALTPLEIATGVWTARKWREYVDENSNDQRDYRAPIDILFATHRAALLAAQPNIEALSSAVAAKIPGTSAVDIAAELIRQLGSPTPAVASTDTEE